MIPVRTAAAKPHPDQSSDLPARITTLTSVLDGVLGRLLTPAQAAAELGRSPESVRRAIRSGALHARDLCHHNPASPRYVVPAEALDRYRRRAGVRR